MLKNIQFISKNNRVKAFSRSIITSVHIKPNSTLDRSLVAEDSLLDPPAIIVLQEWWGINKQVKSFAQRIANGTGADCIIPDLYNGKSTLDQEEAAHLMNNLNWDDALQNLSGLVGDLRKKNEKRKIGSVGFCMGGALSLALASKLAATKNPLNATISFYGVPPMEKYNLASIPAKTPCNAYFGELDTNKGLSDLETAKKLSKLWKVDIKGLEYRKHGYYTEIANVFVLKNKGHAFMSDEPEYINKCKELGFAGPGDKELQGKVWKQVFEFFQHHLKEI
ncbi:hypothetical protein HDU92_000032 [Lobulomyces angularis]|nr:hypothetical protein HDU92_000032 [Lobulomyces angularis]